MAAAARGARACCVQSPAQVGYGGRRPRQGMLLAWTDLLQNRGKKKKKRERRSDAREESGSGGVAEEEGAAAAFVVLLDGAARMAWPQRRRRCGGGAEWTHCFEKINDIM